MRKLYVSILALSFLGLSNAFGQQYNVVSPSEPTLFVIDGTATVLASYPITDAAAGNITGFTGMATDPTSSIIYLVGRDGSTFFLATFNEGTNVSTKIANLSGKVAGIAFDATGNLYGITGNGDANPAHFYSIDKTTAVMTELADFSGDLDDDGESIGYNSVDGFMYRLGGGTYLYKIDLSNNTETLVTDALSNAGITGHALYFDGTNFISLTNWICTMDAAGTQTGCTLLSDDYKGIVRRNDASVETLAQDNLISVYPNPSSSEVTVTIEEGIGEVFTITDQAGKVQLSGTMNALKQSVDVSNLAVGVYTVTIGSSNTKLMIK